MEFTQSSVEQYIKEIMQQHIAQEKIGTSGVAAIYHPTLENVLLSFRKERIDISTSPEIGLFIYLVLEKISTDVTFSKYNAQYFALIKNDNSINGHIEFDAICLDKYKEQLETLW